MRRADSCAGAEGAAAGAGSGARASGRWARGGLGRGAPARPRAFGWEVPTVWAIARRLCPRGAPPLLGPRVSRGWFPTGVSPVRLSPASRPRPASTLGRPRCRSDCGRVVVKVCVGRVFSCSRRSGLGEAGRRGQKRRRCRLPNFLVPRLHSGAEADGKMCAGEACVRAEGSLTGRGPRRACASLYYAGFLGRCATLGSPGLARYCGRLETRLRCELPPLGGCCQVAALCSPFSSLLPRKGLQTALARAVMTKATFLVGLARGFCGLLQGY